MAHEKILGVIQFDSLMADNGNVITAPGATVEVKKESDGNHADIFEDIGGDTSINNNPFTLGENERTIKFYADQEERYEVTITKDSKQKVLRHVSPSVDVKNMVRVDPTEAAVVVDGDYDIGTGGENPPRVKDLRDTSAVTLPQDQSAVVVDSRADTNYTFSGPLATINAGSGGETTVSTAFVNSPRTTATGDLEEDAFLIWPAVPGVIWRVTNNIDLNGYDAYARVAGQTGGVLLALGEQTYVTYDAEAEELVAVDLPQSAVVPNQGSGYVRFGDGTQVYVRNTIFAFGGGGVTVGFPARFYTPRPSVTAGIQSNFGDMAVRLVATESLTQSSVALLPLEYDSQSESWTVAQSSNAIMSVEARGRWARAVETRYGEPDGRKMPVAHFREIFRTEDVEISDSAAFDGDHFYLSAEQTGSFGPGAIKRILNKYDKNFNKVASRDTANDGPGVHNQINGVYLHTDGLLYVTGNKWPEYGSESDTRGFVFVIEPSDLSLVEWHELQPVETEQVFRLSALPGEWFSINNNNNKIYVFNESWEYQREYTLPFELPEVQFRHGVSAPQGAFELDGILYINLHSGSVTPGNGRLLAVEYNAEKDRFDLVANDLRRPNAFCGQGAWTDGHYVYWAERVIGSAGGRQNALVISDIGDRKTKFAPFGD